MRSRLRGAVDGLVRNSARGRMARARSWLGRVTALGLLFWLPLAMWGPAAASAEPMNWPMPTMAQVRAWVAGPPPMPRTPRQGTGTAAGLSHRAPASATRAGRGAGSAPGAGRGQLPAYRPFAPAARKFTTGTSMTSGFNPRTSTLVQSGTTASTDLYKNANGTYTQFVYSGPVNYRTASGTYQPISTQLAAGPGSRWQEKANSLSVSFAPRADNADLGSLGLASGQSYSFGLAGAAAVSGNASGSTVTYPGVLPQTDLTEQATRLGLKESLVLHSASAASTWIFPLHLQGLTATLAPDGSVNLVDASGAVAGFIPHGFATDSAYNPHTGNPARTDAVTYQLTSYQGGQALQVSLDKAWLDNPARVFPVTVDPSGTGSETATGSTYVLYPYTNDYSSDSLMQVGTYDSGSNYARAFYHFANFTADLKDLHITSATLKIFDAWAYACSSEYFSVHQITQSWTNTGNKSWPGPSIGTSLGSWYGTATTACPSSTHTSADPSVGQWLSVGLSTDVLNGWTLGTTPNDGLAIKASTTNSDDYKQFDGYNSPYPPVLEVNWSSDVAPQINSQYPQNNYNATSLTPELQASGSDADNWPDPLTYRFTVENSSGTVVAQSGWQSTPDWTAPAGKLAWDQTYYWYASDYDGLDYNAVNSVNALSTPVPQPVVTSGLSQNSGGQGFDPANDNYTTSATDAQVPVTGPALAITRDYNSEDLRTTGAFGAGWSSMLDMRVAPGLVDSSGNQETVVVTYPDGQQVGFGANSNGSFTAPQGRYATLASVSGGGYTLTDKNDTVYSFTQSLGSGVYGVTSITDALGHALDFTWNSSGQISTITSAASGRALHLTWATPSGGGSAHVASVATDPVTAGVASSALTWIYGYTGDQLTQVCPPGTTTACTDYTYTSGTTYPAAVLDTGPHSFWPLDEASGTTAASSVLVNEGGDNGAYTNVTLGQPGPLAASSQTSAAFNGTSSYVTLPDKLVSSATYQSVSVWFKTTGTDQVLFSYSNTPITGGTTTGQYTPELYVGSSGYLYGEFWDGKTSPIKSAAPVNDGSWHQAVLVSGVTSSGTTEELYVDGVPVGGLTGTVENTAQANDYVGAGFLGGGWPDEAHSSSTSNTGYATYFNGDIADVGFWDQPLTAAQVTAMYQAGTGQASLLTNVTRPSGSVYAQVAYDSGSGAVTQVTDDNGGVWKIGTPADTGSSQVYASSVLGAGPADYWRFTDSGTTDPVNQVNGGVAVNTGVTEGVSGPFSDATAYSFNGTSSYTALPSGLVSGAGNQSVSLWFKTTGTGQVIFASSQDPLTNGTTTGNYVPELYVNSSGDLSAEFWNGSASPYTSSSKVNDGTWHNVVLAADATSQSVYLDGKLLGSLSGTISGAGQDNVYVGAGFIGGTWPNEPHYEQSGNTAYPSYFNGDIAEVAFYNSQLSAAQVASEYNASKYSSGLTPVQTVHVTDPGGKTITYVMDPLNGNRLISETDALGNTTKYGYDSGGFLYDVVNPDGDETITGHDVRGNVVSETTCQDQAGNECSTAYYTYYPDDTSTQLTPSPLNDLLLTARGPGSSSATDNTYLTTYNYGASSSSPGYGELLSETTPAVAGFPNGRTTTTTYTTSSTAAVGGGTTPAGLPMTVTTPGGAVTSTQYYSDGDVAQVTDPDGLVAKYSYDGIGRLTSKTVVSNAYPSGLTTTYVYNSVGEVVTETDPAVTDRVTGAVHTPQITTTYDADGDVLSQTTADLTGGDASRTVTNTYNSHDQLASSTDAAGAKTIYTYDEYGNRVSVTDPAGNVTDYAYNANGQLLTVTLENYTGNPNNPQPAAPLVESSRAYDPAGRLASVTNAMGCETSYTYYDNGLLDTITRSNVTPGGPTCDGQTAATFVVQSNTYNAAGQLVQRVTDNSATTTGYTVDAAGRVTSQTLDPSGLDRTTTYSYSPDDYVVNQTLTGPGTSTPVRSTSYTYDPMGNMTSQSVALKGGGDPTGWWRLDQTSGTTVADSSGVGNTATATNVTWSGGAGVFNGSSSLAATAGPVLNTAASFSVSAWVNMSSAVSWEAAVSQDATQNSAFQLQYDSSTSGWAFGRKNADTTSPTAIRAVSSGDASVGTWAFLTGTYDASTGQMILYVNGAQQGTATDTTPYAANGSLVIGRGQYVGSPVDWFDGSISDVQVYQRALSAAEVSALYQGGRDGGANPANALTTTWKVGQRGLATSMTDPNGNTTYYSYDQAGHLVETTYPAVSTQVYGGSATMATPVTMTGYDTFGEKVETSDPNGNVTTTAYDADGRPVSVTQPNYTPPGASTPITAVTTTTYNNLGQAISQTDPLGNKTTYAYDQLGDVVSQTAPDSGVTTYTYDTNGDQLSSTGPTGAVAQATYDYLGRQLTSTQVERYPSPASYTTQYAYGSNGWLSSQTSPDGVTASSQYDAAGETTSVTDGAQNTTSYAYNAAGQQTKVTYPDGTSSTTTYDEAGRAVGQADLSAPTATTGATVLRSDSATYDDNGNLLSSTDYRGHTTTFTYDPMNWLTSETQPVTATSAITTSFGYDMAGNQTLYTDGNGNQWWTTYNSWNLPESQIEPATSSYSSPADSTFTTAYDANGNPVSLAEPGGVTVSSTYNNMGELTGQSGSGADAATASRSFGYDQAGNLTSASTSSAGSQPATSESFTYNDRGLVLTASGSAGSSSFAYNGDGQPVSVTDGAGTTSYTYDSAGRLKTLADPLTGATATYSYNPMSQVSQISYGTGNDVRSFGYNSLHQLTSDTLATAGGQSVASVSYGYDPNGNLTSKTTTGFAGSSANTYTYDYANRLTSWNNGTTTVNYAYDAAGNRTQAGSVTSTYDARDELTSNGSSTYSYTARGTLSSIAGASGTTSFASDAYGQSTTQAGQSFAYDALGRPVSVTGSSGTAALSYVGAGSALASDGTWNYTWGPGGTTLAGIGTVGGAASSGVVAFTDQHTDVTGDFSPSGSSLAGSATYDPWGQVTATSGLAGSLGFQSGWTDPGSSLVHMGARWYSPSAGQFTSKDTWWVSPVPSSGAANRFAYAAGNPMTWTDPSGHYLPAVGGYCSASCHASAGAVVARMMSYTPRASVTSSSSSCSWMDVMCQLSHAWHTATTYYHKTLRVTGAVANVLGLSGALRDARAALARGMAMAGRLTADVQVRISDAARMGAHVLAHSWATMKSAGAAVYHTATRYASEGYRQAAHVVTSVYHVVKRAATTTVDFVKRHGAAIASVLVSTAVFVGCDAALGVSTGGVGAVVGAAACGELAGAAGSAVSYGVTAAQTGKFSWSGLAGATATGAVTGALTGAAGGALGEVVSGVVGGLLGGGAAAAASDAAGTAAASGAEATASAAASDGAASVAEDSSGLRQAAGCLGGQSFTASTRVLLASGALVAISALRPGDKVVAVSTKTGKNQVRAVAAVWVHHDKNLYDLKVATRAGTAVIHTTSSHLFWDQATRRWVKAGALRHGAHLRTPSGAPAIAVGGWTPRHHTGWMWDLTIPVVHDFYINARQTAILVHNCPVGPTPGQAGPAPEAGNAAQAAVSELRGTGTVGASRNIAGAEVSIDGQAPYMLRSVSGEAERAGTVPNVGSPGNLQRFVPQATGNNTRFFDSEFKLLNAVANRLGPASDSVSGTINLYSELPVCTSCSSVIGQFMDSFPNINLNVTSGG